MRHLVSVLCVWMLCALPANAQQGREEDGLLGPVSTVVEERAQITSHYGSLMEGPRIRTQKMVYDEWGALLERILYSKDGEVENRLVCTYDSERTPKQWKVYDGQSQLLRQKEYLFDATGRLLRETWRTGKDRIITQQRTYRYSEEGTLLEVADEQFGTHRRMSMLTRYGTDGQIAEEMTYRRDGELSCRTVYSYDDEGRISELNRYDQPGKLLNRVVYSYGADGNVSEAAWYGADRVMQFKWLSKYDERGNLLEISRYTPEGKPDERNVFHTVYRYKYDQQGNWIEKHVTEWRNLSGRIAHEPIEVFYREITYL